jgi:hypothetical protein
MGHAEHHVEIAHREQFPSPIAQPLLACIGLTLRTVAVPTGNGELSITCRNRHCPKCQANARDRWLQAREKELLPTRYVHVVFTLPQQLAPLALQNKREIYALLFQASAETLIEVARDPQRLGAENRRPLANGCDTSSSPDRTVPGVVDAAPFTFFDRP